METTLIQRAHQIHGNKYDYSKSVYKNAFTKICVVCPYHGEFYIRPNNHINGKQGCKKCGIKQRFQNNPKSIENFILDCKKVHGDKYNYSKSIYTNNHTKIEIVCFIHGSFFQTPNAHLNGQGCPLCNRNHHKSILDYNKPTKVCNRCHVEKSVDEYYTDDVYYRGNCKECEKREKVEYRKIPINKERIRTYHKKYRNNRRLIDPVYRMRVDIPSIIRKATKKKYYKDSVWNYLPYTPQDLKRHLEMQFDTSMTWDNHGKEWHIDHIIPQAAFHYDSENHPDFQKCWALNNLRPLRAIDNMKKSSIYNGKRVVNKYL
jgi:hypothetical protein